jgi:hypothetical protein
MVVAGKRDARTARDRHPCGSRRSSRASRARHFASVGIAVEIIFVQGSVELAPLTG